MQVKIESANWNHQYSITTLLSSFIVCWFCPSFPSFFLSVCLLSPQLIDWLIIYSSSSSLLLLVHFWSSFSLLNLNFSIFVFALSDLISYLTVFYLLSSCVVLSLSPFLNLLMFLFFHTCLCYYSFYFLILSNSFSLNTLVIYLIPFILSLLCSVCHTLTLPEPNSILDSVKWDIFSSLLFSFSLFLS